MAVTNKGKSFTMTAAADARTDILHMVSLALVGTGMTAGQRLTITDTSGDVIADHYVEAANENKEFLLHPRWCKGVLISAAPAGGTYTVVGQFD